MPNHFADESVAIHLVSDLVAVYTKIMKHAEQILSRTKNASLFSYVTNYVADFPPDFCVELAEALSLGRNLPRNIPLARDLLESAVTKEPLVGNYGLGRYFSVVNPECCYDYFKKASTHGHIPSKIIISSLIQQYGGLQGHLARINLRYISFGAAIKLSLGENSLQYWRYYDVAPKSELNQKLLPHDREEYFPWSRPMSLSEYAALCRSDSVQATQSR